MNKRSEQELFLNYIRDIYLAYPSLEITEDTIYNELSHFYEENGIRKRIGNNGLLLNVQQSLTKKFGSKFSSGGYFWFYENRKNFGDTDYYNKLYDAIKLYISVDAENLYDVTRKVIEYMQKENVLTQTKVAKNMRNDVLVVRVANGEEAKKVIDFVNGLGYKSSIKPNPFVFSSGKVSITKDGSLSYNGTVCNMITNYLRNCRFRNKMDSANIDGLYKYVNDTIKKLKGPYKKEAMQLYQIDTEQKYKDILMTLNIISKNLDGTITLEEIFEEEKGKNVSSTSTIKKDDKDKIKYVLSGLSKYYSTSDIHSIMIQYISDGRLEHFTRRDNIRQVMTSFTPEKLDAMLTEMSYNALIDAVIATKEKYPNINQAEYAIKLFVINSDLSGFTNDNNSRSYLGLVSLPTKIIDALTKDLPDSYKNALYSIINLNYEERSIMKKLLDKSDVSKIPSEALSTARGNLALLDNLTRFITNNIYENNKKDVKIARGY